ncbi:glycoside hydrolase family 97 protein [Alteromonas aestuariivivens]|uniref:Glycoside hydrolase family 97 protein n=1 Tax=Alteromonas aestuariivivens TaxID=1938339 RepID=A0A3D8M891_9ALTE|nr:glycoside hydrolase family 97 protein [Alteromonas aestuariivivens]RDV26047.1 glycoside hydrolase family 97 protein [Alteromonas aestuariivivens]
MIRLSADTAILQLLRVAIPAVVLSLTLLSNSSASESAVSVSSPDGKLAFKLEVLEQGLSYSVRRHERNVIAPSRLGLRFLSQTSFADDLQIEAVERNTMNEVWEQPWGEQRLIRDHHNEILVKFLQRGVTAPVALRVRVFNDGIGFRYEGQGDAKTPLVIMDDLTEFRFERPDSTEAWWIPAKGWNRYEYEYRHTALNQLDRVHTPVTLKLDDGTHVAIHEAALVDFASMTLDQRRDGVLKSELVERADGARVRTHAAFVSPWRTLQIGGEATDLLNSYLILNLNEPNKLGDVSWVKPGKYIGIWWGMHLNVHTWGTDGEHGATTERTKQYMDFAALHGFNGVLVEGWNIGWDGSWFHNGDVFSFTASYPDFDIKAVTDYGAQLGVELIGHHETSGSITNYERQMEAAYQLYAKHGVTQIKTGYVADGGDTKWVDENGKIIYQWHDSQPMVNHYLHSVKTAAKHKISINTHEPVKATGLRRTYPNWISREGARGQEFNAWGSPPNSPEHTATLPFTRLLGGPMDFTPGIVNLAFEGLDAENRVQTTLAKQLALYVVLYSPIQMAADLPEHYEQQPEALRFIEAVPTDWEQSLALAGEVGEFVVTARQQRGSEDWFVGGLTNSQARSVQISLSFLKPGSRYRATLWQDGSEADWRKRPYDMEVVDLEVTAESAVTLNMATSGGVAIKLQKLD